MKKIVLTLCVTAFFGSLFAQNNLVPNSDFSMIEKKVKGPGSIMLASPWFGTNEEYMADLYQVGNKKGFGIPDNDRGSQDDQSGGAYAGIRAYSYNAKEPRTYLQVKLTKPLVEGKRYCVSFDLSLADLSKYGVNNVGAVISSTKLKDKNIAGGTIVPQVKNSQNKIFQDQYLFETVCSIVTAIGGERYLCIGNFASDVEMKKKTNSVKLRKPSGFQGMQSSDAYYYIDNVKVINLEELTTCDCEPEDRNQMQVQHTENISETIDMSAGDILMTKKIFFSSNSVSVSNGTQMQEVVDLMTENSGLNVTIVGHTDAVEEKEYIGNLSEKRAEEVYNYLVEQGIDASRLSKKAAGSTDPDDDSGTRDSLAKNRRVSFEVK